MKSGFSKSVTYVPTFHNNKDLPEGERLSVTLIPLTLGDLLSLTEAGQKAPDATDVESTRIILESCSHLLPKYATIHGAEDFTMEDVVTYLPFLPLAAELLGELQRISAPNETDVKN